MTVSQDWQEMAASIQEMLDHYEITKVIATYCHACDRLDEVQTGSVYWPDSWDDHGLIKASGPDFVKLAMASLAQVSESCSHQLGQSLVNITGDEAGAETYFQAVAVGRHDNGAEVLNLLGGRFVDMLERRGGRWKFKSRLVVRDWSATLPIEQDWLVDAPHARGQRSGQDPSCAVLGMPHSELPGCGTRGAGRHDAGRPEMGGSV